MILSLTQFAFLVKIDPNPFGAF